MCYVQLLMLCNSSAGQVLKKEVFIKNASGKTGLYPSAVHVVLGKFVVRTYRKD